MAFLDSVGAGEWVVLFVVILIVVGPKRLPDVVRKLGRTMEMFRRAADEFKDQLMTMDQEPSTSGKPSTALPTSPDADGVHAAPSSGETYPDMAGYPGNEDHVENWQATDASAASSAVPVSDEASAAAPAASAPSENSRASSPQPEKSPEVAS